MFTMKLFNAARKLKSHHDSNVTRARLENLSDRMLKDIGVERWDIRRVSRGIV